MLGIFPVLVKYFSANLRNRAFLGASNATSELRLSRNPVAWFTVNLFMAARVKDGGMATFLSFEVLNAPN
jgi:hypothetical protein